jgi:hypothetical protein
MALSPGIPTSFVPRQPISPSNNRRTTEGTNLFFIVTVLICGFAVLVSVGVFAYDRYLKHVVSVKTGELMTAQAAVNQDTVEEFIRLQNRLVTGKTLLSNHIVLSQFFDTLEALTLANVRFESLKLSVAGDHTAQVDFNGVAKNFNTLAAQSNTFAGEKRIKRAIFSGITLTKGNQVEFRLTADLDPRLVLSDGIVSTQETLTVPVSVPAVPVSQQQEVTPTSSTTAPLP